MTTINSILNPSYVVTAIEVGKLPYKNSFQLRYYLDELDPFTKNKRIEIISNSLYKLALFKSDYQKHSNPLQIFNSSIRGLTKVPDYILFYELPTVIYAIIIELKSHHFSGVEDKFKNGAKIAEFINNFYNQGKNLQVRNLLFRLPERPLKKPVYFKNENFIYQYEFGYACTLKHIYFDQLIKAMNLNAATG